MVPLKETFFSSAFALLHLWMISGCSPQWLIEEKLKTLNDVAQIAAGDYHNCALLNDTSVKCWGFNSSGQIGDGTNTDRITPSAISGLSGVKTIAAGTAHTCAIQNGSVKCRGLNSAGQLGDGTTTDQTTPIVVSR